METAGTGLGAGETGTTSKIRPFECPTCSKRFTRQVVDVHCTVEYLRTLITRRQENLKRHARSCEEIRSHRLSQLTVKSIKMKPPDLSAARIVMSLFQGSGY